MKLLRVTVVLATCLAALLGTTALASAAPAPKLTPEQVQALCVAKNSIELLKAVDKQRWKDLRAKAAALKAIPGQAKAACSKPGTTPQPQLPIVGGNFVTADVSQTITLEANLMREFATEAQCGFNTDNGDPSISGYRISGATSIVTGVRLGGVSSEFLFIRVSNGDQPQTLTIELDCRGV